MEGIMWVAVYKNEDRGGITIFEIDEAPGPIHIVDDMEVFERISLAFEAESCEAAAAEWQSHTFAM